MTADELKSFYTDRASNHTTALNAVLQEISVISNLRLASALLSLVLFFVALDNRVLFLPVVGVLLVFVFLVVKHATLFRRKQILENLVALNLNEVQRLEGNHGSFDDGAIFTDGHHPYTHDLDIFGGSSLFQVINRCNTIGGKRKLAERLSAPLQSTADILANQKAIKELSEAPAFLEELQATTMSVEERADDRAQLREWVTHKPFVFGRTLYRVLLVAGPLLTLALLLTTFFMEGTFRFFLMAAAGQWIFLGFHLKKINSFHQYISRKQNVLLRYADVLQIIENSNFKDALLVTYVGKAKHAHKELTGFASLVRALDARLNFLTTLFVNSLLMYDMQCVYRLEKWKEQNAHVLEKWLDTVEEFELVSSFGTFAFNNRDFTFPQTNSQGELLAVAMGHPLIPFGERVPNDFAMSPERSVVIITGANMAGKSTFLRTLGVNFILALIGAPVCAASFNCPILQLRTGMRTADSLRDHQSYFYAELNRLKSIMDEIKSGTRLLVLLDEILKGTNSTDKQAGSIALVKQLKNFETHVVIATHDLALSELEKEFPVKVRNYCFEPSIVDDQLSFDYKLKPGVAVKMNATFLMKKMGIIPQ
jgi:hypothetical protein